VLDLRFISPRTSTSVATESTHTPHYNEMVERTFSEGEINALEDLETIDIAPAISHKIRRVRDDEACHTKTDIIGKSYGNPLTNPRLRFVKDYESPRSQTSTNQSRYLTPIYPGAYVIAGGKSPLVVQTSACSRRRSPPVESWSAEKSEIDPSLLTSDGKATTVTEPPPSHPSRAELPTIY